MKFNKKDMDLIRISLRHRLNNAELNFNMSKDNKSFWVDRIIELKNLIEKIESLKIEKNQK